MNLNGRQPFPAAGPCDWCPDVPARWPWALAVDGPDCPFGIAGRACPACAGDLAAPLPFFAPGEPIPADVPRFAYLAGPDAGRWFAWAIIAGQASPVKEA